MKLSNDKLILVIGGTGAQGQAVVKALVEPSSDGAPSPYTVRILTRNPDHPKVKAEFNQPNIELVRGSFTDLARVERAFGDVWGAYINTDGFTVGEQVQIRPNMVLQCGNTGSKLEDAEVRIALAPPIRCSAAAASSAAASI